MREQVVATEVITKVDAAAEAVTTEGTTGVATVTEEFVEADQDHYQFREETRLAAVISTKARRCSWATCHTLSTRINLEKHSRTSAL